MSRFSFFTDAELSLFCDGVIKDECGWAYTPEVDDEPHYSLARELYEEALARGGIISPYDVDRWNFKVSDTPPRGPEGNSGHPATPGPPNNKEIA